MSELWTLTALELGERIGAGDVLPSEVLDAHLARIADVNSSVNAVTRTVEDVARDLARDADERAQRGQRRSPLDGVPFTTKENLDLVGAPTTEGLVALADNMPPLDAPIVERLKAAGAVPFARTNMPDLGLRVHTDNDLHGATINPWDAGRTCGGSSGGEGVAIATGMSPMGLGNDIGGSVRNPAYCSGIAAHKATPHRLPRSSSTPPTSWGPAKQLMSVEGPMARSVADLRAMFDVMHGRHARDPWSVSTPFAAERRTERLRVALVPEPDGGTTSPVVADGVRKAGHALAAAGHEVVEVQPPQLTEVRDTWLRWLAGELDLRREGIDPVLSEESRVVLDLLAGIAGPQTLGDTVDALTQRHHLAQLWLDFFAEFPVVVGPMWTDLPFEVGFDLEESEAVLELLRFTVAANVLALPATCVPVDLGPAGLPRSVQVLARQHADDLTLDIAGELEDAFGLLTPIEPIGS